MKYLTAILIFICVIFQSCNSDSIEKEPTPVPFNTISKGEQVVKANNDFAFSLFKEITANESEENFMISPVSASIALNMVYNGSANKTEQAFANVFNYGDATKDQTNAVNKNIIEHLTYSGSGSSFNIANSLWIRNTFPVKEDFISVNKEFYDAEVNNMDFSDSQAVDAINTWVSDKTNGKIKDVIKQISPEMVMYAINALYFKSDWKYEFKLENNKNLPFYSENGTSKNVTMMNLEQNLQFYSSETFTSAILPYKDDAYSMTLLLPNTNKTISDVVAELNQENWNSWQNQYNETRVKITLPKFKLSYKKFFNDPLVNLGLGNAFSDSANFSNLSDVATKISFVLQKTFIDVNEVGTEAAAVTVVGIGVTSEPSIIEFKLDNPFLYVITNKETGAICFIGKVGMPKYE